MADTVLRLKIQRGESFRWERSTRDNPDDALTELEARGAYDFDAGDTLRKVVRTEVDEDGNVRVA